MGLPSWGRDNWTFTIIKITPGTTTATVRIAGAEQQGSGTTYPLAIGEEINAINYRFHQHLGGLTIGHDGALYVADGLNNGRILRIDPDTGKLSIFVGGTYGNPFRIMGGLTYVKGANGKQGYYYVVDHINNDAADGTGRFPWPVIWRISENKEITRIIGKRIYDTPRAPHLADFAFENRTEGRTTGTTDGVNNADRTASNIAARTANMIDGNKAIASFHRPWGIAADVNGNIYVVDNALTHDDYNDLPAGVIRKIFWDRSTN